MESKEFVGVHSEWNMGSPGGWDYQRMAQEIGRLAWWNIKKKSGIDIELDFDHPILNPVPNFADLLLSAHRRLYPEEDAVIAVVAEKETLDKVGENIRFVEHLNTLSGVEAILTEPSRLSWRDGRIFVDNKRITLIFLDFNIDVIIRLAERYNLDPLLKAIRAGMVVNPKGMEPLGAKGIFEAITSEYKEEVSEATFRRTPWTRQFYPRSTTGPNGEEISDLIEWTRSNWERIILKPVHGHSGKGIIIGRFEPDKDKGIKDALNSGEYIIQELIPLKLWQEDFPWLDRKKEALFIKPWQTDFRCFITNKGLIGFVTRFGGIPTNVGSGGGVQSTAILLSDIPLKTAVERINNAILELGYDYVYGLQKELDRRSVEIGSVYLLGPIMCTLRPRIITPSHIEQLREYAQHLWDDALKLERLWMEGRLDRYTQIPERQREIAKMAPWEGTEALIASDGLFGFL